MNENLEKIKLLRKNSADIYEEIFYCELQIIEKENEIKDLKKKIKEYNKKYEIAENNISKIINWLMTKTKENDSLLTEIEALNNFEYNDSLEKLKENEERVKISELEIKQEEDELELKTKNEILKIFNTYDIKQNQKKIYDYLLNLSNADIVKFALYKRNDAYQIYNNLEKAKLLELIRSCKYNEMTIRSDVNKSINNELKNQMKEVKIKSCEFFDMLEEWLITNIEKIPLNKNMSDLETFLFTKRNMHRIGLEDDKLLEIIDFEIRKQNLMDKMSLNRAIGLICKTMYRECVDLNYINKKQPITKQYSFIYDCIAFFELASELDINKEKYTKVKDWIKTFEVFQESLKS